MSDRDELQDLIDDTAVRSRHEAAGVANPDGIADAILAAGYAKPRQINNYSELAALPYGSAVLTSDISDTVVLRSDRDDFMNQSGYTIPARTLWDYGSKPLTVLWEPLP